jgi:hypothetical protein
MMTTHFTRRAWMALVAGGLAATTRLGRAVVHTASAVQSDWRPLFDGNSLGHWKPTSFGGEGDVTVEGGEIRLAQGNDLTGITWTGEVVRTSYEIELQAKRVSGGDFFCGLTFPVGDAYCSFIVGGWAGAVSGLSSLDGLDASENETTRVRDFAQGRWYTVRVRVTADRIQAWIDDESFADVKTTGRRISIRPEVQDSRPLGIASWRTRAALRAIRLRTL